MTGPVDTEVTPPEAMDDEGGDIASARLSVMLLDVDGVHYDAAMQFFAAMGPDEFGDALLRLSLALASLRGPDHAWAAAQRFAAYDGTVR